MDGFDQETCQVDFCDEGIEGYNKFVAIMVAAIERNGVVMGVVLLLVLGPRAQHAAGLREQVQRRRKVRRILVEDFVHRLPSLRRRGSAGSRRCGW